jgi:hypothetical protein
VTCLFLDAMFSCSGRVDHIPCSADHTPVSYQKMEKPKKAFADCTTRLLLFQFLSCDCYLCYFSCISIITVNEKQEFEFAEQEGPYDVSSTCRF